MADGCFIGIDQGSSSTKALVISREGQMLFQTRRNLHSPLREGPRVEQDPLEILTSVREVLEEAAGSVSSSGMPIFGIGLSCQRSSCLIWNERTGEPLSSVLSWRDSRGADFCAAIAGDGASIFDRTGLPLTPYYSASKFRWLKEHVPAAGSDTTVFGTLSSFLVQRLTGGAKAAIDHTNAARTQLMNLRTLDWDPELLKIFGLAGIRLPAILPSLHEFGEIRTPSGTFPLAACIGDQQSAMAGLGVLEEGDGGINYGTGGFLMVNTGGELKPVRGLMNSVLYSTEKSKRYAVEGSVNAVGEALEWLRVRLGLFKDYAEVDDLCWKASTDTVVFVGLNGTGAPHWEPEISTALHGLTLDSTQADIVRGTVEGISFFMADIAEEMRSAGIEPSSFTLSGGLVSLSYLVQIQADILKRDVRVSPEQEASALGAALLAGLQHGSWTSADIRKMALLGDTVRGENNPGLERRYRRWKELHKMTKVMDQT